MMSRETVLILLAISLNLNEAARILAWFPTPSISHQIVFRPLTQELAKRGHEVTVITPDPAFPRGETPKNLEEIDVHDISYAAWIEIFMARQNEMSDDIPSQMVMIFEAMVTTFDAQLNTTAMKRIIRGDEKYDLLLIEACAVATLALRHIIDAPVIQVSSLGALPGQMDAAGAPSHPFLYPLSLRKRTYNLTFWEKLQELYLLWKIDSTEDIFLSSAQNMLTKHFGENLPLLKDLSKNVDLLLLNEHPLWSDNRPVPPNVVFIGGIHQNPKKSLPKDLKDYLDSSKHGVIYMSFGTNVDPSVLPREKIQAFINVFSKLPYDVLWKWNEDELEGRTQNIRISKWLPQSDLLCHPNVKLFITQGGLQSTDEAITAGVPVIGVPMLADQWYNVEHYTRHGVGLQLDIRTLDEDKVRKAIETAIGDKSYRENMVKLRELLRDQPMSPLARAVWWTEHVLRHGGASHLRTPAAHMPWSHYYEVHLVLTVVGIAMAALLVVLAIIYYLVTLLRKSVRRIRGGKVKSS